MADWALADNALYETMGLKRIVAMEPEGTARLEYEAKLEQCHSGGVVQGGFVTGWIDAAMAHAAIAMHGDAAVPISLELKISFFAPVRPGRVVAEGWIVRAGKRTNFLEGQLLDMEGNVLAKGTSTMTLVDHAKMQRASEAASEASS